MLRLIPRPLHRGGLIAAHHLRQVWWRFRRPTLTGCRVLALDAAGRVLLVRHSYGSGRWMLPGGGLRRGEDALVAGQRELLEEVGCTLTDGILVAVVEEPLSGATNRVHVVAGRVAQIPLIDGREIVEVGMFDAAALPPGTAASAAAGLAGWLIAAEAALRPRQAGSSPDPDLPLPAG